MTISEATKAIISMSDTAAVAVSEGQIDYMNPAAADLFGGDFSGRALTELLPDLVDSDSGDGFVASAVIKGSEHTVKAVNADGVRLLLISGESCRTQLGEGIETVMRGHMANIRLIITGLINLAENSGDKKLSDYTSMLNRTYYRIVRNLDNLSVINRSQRNDLAFIPEELDIAKLFGDIINTVSTLTEGRNLKFTFEHESNLRLVADRNLVQQLLLNLLSNSIKACEHGGAIVVTLKRLGGSVVLSVKDNGCGICGDELATVFERYKHESSPEWGARCGMGLTAARIIAAKHDGALVIESRGKNMGTGVRVTLASEPSAVAEALHAPDRCFGSSSEIQPLLTGLSDCLDFKCFSGILED